MKTNRTRWSITPGLLALFLILSGAAWAQDACFGALIPNEGGTTLGSATGCGVIITVTAVDVHGVATAFSVNIPNGGNGNPYDGTDDTLVGVVNNSGAGLTSITLTTSNLTFGGAFNFNQDGPCNFGQTQYESSQDCTEGQLTGYEGHDNFFSGITGPPLCGEGFTCPTTGTVNFTEEGGLGNGSTSWFALVGTPSSINVGPMLLFTPTQTSAVATFNCTTNTIPCPDQGAHSMKFSLNSVSQSFSITLLALEVDGDGVCESGNPNDATDPIDCRFVRYFGEPPFNGSPFQPTKVPLCYAYSSTLNSAPFHCVVYSVQNAPPTTGFYTGPVLESIAWNTLETPPAGYVNSPQMYDDPSDDLNLCNCYPTIMGGPFSSFPYSLNNAPYNVEDNQFVFDITTFFNPNPGTVGTDPTTGGKTKTFNDFVIAFPLTIAQVQQPVNSDGSSVFNAKRGVIPIKFNLTQDGVATCNLPPATLSLSRLSTNGVGTVDESTYSMAADSGSSFRISGCQYIYNLAASAVGAGQYKVGLQIGNEIVGIAYFELK